MSLRFLLALALLAAPLAWAHTPAGTTKNYCEPVQEWNTHEYTGVSGAGAASARPPVYDGNLGGDCNGNGVPFDYDVHHEWGAGWARIDSVDGDGITSGTQACYGTFGHHGQFGPFTVQDIVIGESVHFFVMADTYSALPQTGDANCGDGQITPCQAEPCIGTDSFAEFVGGSGIVSFGPGLDGSYYVVIADAAVAGHVIW